LRLQPWQTQRHRQYQFTVNINTVPGREILLKLVEGADVLLENYRPGVLERSGLAWEVLRERNPRLIYCSISGFGPEGPYAERPAYDTVAQSMSGVLFAAARSRAAFADELLEAPAERLDAARHMQCLDRHVGRERVPLQAVESQHLLVHGVSPSSFLASSLGR
jgi:CoA-transferase family III